MKFSAPLLLLAVAALSLNACTTAANRRDLFSPNKGGGYWTNHLNEDHQHRGIFGVSNSETRGIFGISNSAPRN